MPLQEEDFQPPLAEIAVSIRELLAFSEPFVEKHRVNTSQSFRGFVPSNFELVCQWLDALHRSSLLCGNRFCEWGSGLGTVASMASLLGFDAYGIDYNFELSQVAEELISERSIAVNLYHGSFVPSGVDEMIDDAFAHEDGELSLHVDSDGTYGSIGYDIEDFDLVFAFPWPNDVALVQAIFEHFAASGAMLLLYNDRDSLSLFRKQ